MDEHQGEVGRKPVIDRRKCPAQGDICTVIAVCEVGAVAYVEDAQEPLGGRIVIDYALCNDCGLCVPACCGHAIEMQAYPVAT